MNALGFADAPAGADNPLLEHLGIRLVEVQAGHAAFEIDVGPRHLNRQGSLQGHAVTVSLTISYLAKASAGRLRATGTVTKAGRSLYFSSGELKSASGELIATAQGAFKRNGADSLTKA
jgi:acyl-coenzyme A thioesterase PaaI-like protein